VRLPPPIGRRPARWRRLPPRPLSAPRKPHARVCVVGRTLSGTRAAVRRGGRWAPRRRRPPRIGPRRRRGARGRARSRPLPALPLSLTRTRAWRVPGGSDGGGVTPKRGAKKGERGRVCFSFLHSARHPPLCLTPPARASSPRWALQTGHKTPSPLDTSHNKHTRSRSFDCPPPPLPFPSPQRARPNDPLTPRTSAGDRSHSSRRSLRPSTVVGPPRAGTPV